jgi:hypothetical protein
MMIEDLSLPGWHLAQMKEGIKGSRLSYAAPGQGQVFNENFPLSLSPAPPWLLKAKKLSFET